MTAALLENFDLLAASLGGVAKLRELILSLAVRGRLVPQDPNDEPASELLKRIRAEKDRLIKEGKIKRDKPLAAIGEDEKLYGLPHGWQWARLAALGTWAIGSGFPNAEQGLSGQEILFAKVSDMNLMGNEKKILQTNNSISWETAARIRINVHPAGTVIFPKIGGAIATNKRRMLVKPTAIDNNCLGITPHSGCSTSYLYLLLTSIDFTKYQAGTSVPALSQGALGDIVIALPPLAEQSRIVAKVEELMALCDRLEAEQSHAARVQGHWVDAALDQLAASADADEFRHHWQHLSAHFDTLFTTPESIDRLDATLLQLAVRGKLVPQDPNDEPASELLKQIRAEKDRLIKEGKIKRDKALPPINDDEKPYALPHGWEWGRFSDVILASDAGWSPSCESVPRAGSQWGVLKVSAVTWGEFRPHENKALPDHLDPRPECEVKAGDFLLSRANTEDLVARSVVALNPPERLMLSDKLIRLRLSNLVDKALFCFINNATDSRAHYIANASGTSSSMKNVSREVILSLPVPIPPAQEQSRIVAQVEKLLALTASLKARLTAAQTKQAHLAEALIAALTTATPDESNGEERLAKRAQRGHGREAEGLTLLEKAAGQ